MSKRRKRLVLKNYPLTKDGSMLQATAREWKSAQLRYEKEVNCVKFHGHSPQLPSIRQAQLALHYAGIELSSWQVTPQHRRAVGNWLAAE